MATKAFQKIYTKITQITKATCSLKATGVGYDELATVNGKLAQVVKIAGDEVTLQVFEGTEGIPTNAEVVFLGKAPTIKVSEQLAGRFFNAFGDPIDGGPAIEGEEVEIGGPSVNPVRRKQPSELIATGIAGIDLNNTLVSGQKIPFFADPDQPFNQVMANVALRAETDKIILGGMGMTNDDYLYFKNVFSNAGALDRIVSFMNTTENPPVERLLIPDMALTAAEYFAVNNNEKGAGAADGYDFLRRCARHRVQPYGPDSFEGLHAGFPLFGLGEDIRKGGAVPKRRFHHDYCGDDSVRWRHYACRARQYGLYHGRPVVPPS